jgi:hypothetical protein
MEWPEKIVFGLFGLLAFSLVALAVDYVGGETVWYEVEVVDRVYRPSSTGVGVGTGTSSSGGSGSVVVVTSEPERWSLVVSRGDKVEARRVSPREWANASQGQRIRLPYRRGLTGVLLY